MSNRDASTDSDATDAPRPARHFIISSRDTCWLLVVCMVAGFLLGRWLP